MQEERENEETRKNTGAQRKDGKEKRTINAVQNKCS
jgi:hypothetical protein